MASKARAVPAAWDRVRTGKVVDLVVLNARADRVKVDHSRRTAVLHRDIVNQIAPKDDIPIHWVVLRGMPFLGPCSTQGLFRIV